jgi:hypothetical protein
VLDSGQRVLDLAGKAVDLGVKVGPAPARRRRAGGQGEALPQVKTTSARLAAVLPRRPGAQARPASAHDAEQKNTLSSDGGFHAQMPSGS